jgi:PAS domain-containing protein
MATKQKADATKTFLQSVIDCALDVVQVFRAVRDEKRHIIDFTWLAQNRNAVAQNGDVIGKSLLQQNPGVMRSGIFDRMVQVTETGVAQRYEQSYSFEQFRTQWFYQSLVKYEDGILMTSRDITAHKMAEQQIIKGNNLLQSLFNSSLNMITVVEAVRNDNGDVIDFRYLLTNTLARQTEGGDPSGELFLTRHPEMAGTEHLQNLKMVVETGQPAEWEIYYGSKGDDNWYKLKAVKIGDGVALTADDITERKKAEQEMLRIKDELAQRVTDKYYRIINSMDEGFCIIEVLFNNKKKAIDYRFLEVNGVFEKQTGLTNVVGKTMRELADNIEEHWFEIFGDVASTGTPRRFQHEAKPLKRWYNVYAFRIDKPKEHHVAILFNNIPAPDRKKVQEP